MTRVYTARWSLNKSHYSYFIRTPLNACPIFFIWSTKRPVALSTLVQRLLRGESTCERFFTSPVRPRPFLPFFAILKLYHRALRRKWYCTPCCELVLLHFR